LARPLPSAEAAELAAGQVEQRSGLAAAQTARPGTPESDIEDVVVPSTPPLAGESRGGTTIALAISTLERLHAAEAQAQPPASTAFARIEQGRGRDAAWLVSCTGIASTSYD
jgi:hypothetical protein